MVMPNITFIALLRTAFEMATGGLILGKGRSVKIGLAASVVQHIFLWSCVSGTQKFSGRQEIFSLRGCQICCSSSCSSQMFCVHFDQSLARSPASKERVNVDGDQAFAHPDWGASCRASWLCRSSE
jgi:hypothetical protein